MEIRTNLVRRILVAAAISICLAAQSGLAETLYSLIEIEAPAGLTSYAYGLNEHGQVVGSLLIGEGRSAYVRNPDGVVHAFAASPGSTNVAWKINEAGTIVGWSQVDNTHHAAIFGPGELVTDLGILVQDSSYAWALNDSDTVVGIAWAGGHCAVVWDQPGHPRQLAEPFSDAWSINNAGQIVGSAPFGSMYHASLWTQDGQVIDLGSLFGPQEVSVAFDINEVGQVVGDSLRGYESHAFIYDESSGMRSMGTLGGDSRAYAINDLGQAVGFSVVGADRHAFVYQGGQMLDLNNLVDAGPGWVLAEAYDINNAGQIVGYGKHDGLERAFLLTPVPEPAMLVLLLCGITALGPTRRLRCRCDTENL